MAVHDSYKRLLSPSMETEIRLATKKRADEEAIRVFVENLRQLLIAPPLGQKNILAIDPGFRTGCKVVCLDRQGKLLHTETIYPLQSEKTAANAGSKIIKMCEQFRIEAIAVGNGNRRKRDRSFPSRPRSFKEHSGGHGQREWRVRLFGIRDGTRGVSRSGCDRAGSRLIGRRLMDPLAELVKIDPKSIGVGQYQHDVDQGALKDSLDDVVISCVNRVGVEVNTASKQLLTYVSGLGPQLAKGIVEYRNEHGPFKSREGLIKVPRLGPKALSKPRVFYASEMEKSIGSECCPSGELSYC